jgi:hypothetical protein
MRQAQLPEDIALLLQYLAGEDVLSELRRDNALLMQDLVEHYVVAVMFYPGADPARVLGVRAGATRDQMRTHLRWLMIWLHPDRAGASWRASYSARVLEAWRKVSSAPATVRLPDIKAPRTRRPQTRPVKLAWVPSPVARRARSRSVAVVAPIMIALVIAAVTVIDNPVRQWAASTIIAYASEVFRFEARPGS